MNARNVTEALAVEVPSPSTRGRDLVEKRAKYESAAVASYWVVDPDPPSVLAWDLVDRRYQIAGQAIGGEKLELKLPFPVALTPSALLERYNR
jgi:Uma2 family endonuclease